MNDKLKAEMEEFRKKYVRFAKKAEGASSHARQG
jgi:hypothetical protein